MELLTSKQKEEIVRTRYSYYDYTKETIENIAHKSIDELVYKDGAVLVQALYPHNLICSGLFDLFLIFECHNGKRVDPPKVAYSNIDNKELLNKIFNMFESEGIKPHESWFALRNKVNLK